MKRIVVIVGLLSCAVASGAVSKKKAAPAPTEPQVDHFRVELPELYTANQLNATAKAEADNSSKQSLRLSQLYLGASSWKPRNLGMDSRLPGASSFSGIGIPAVSLTFSSSPWLSGRSGDLRLRGGLGFLNLRRSGTLSETSNPDSQNLYLIPAELGLEYHPRWLSGRRFSAYLAESALPTLALTQRSIFDDGSTSFGIAAQTAIGGEFLFSSFALDVNFAMVAGSVANGSLYGTGVGAGMRFDL